MIRNEVRTVQQLGAAVRQARLDARLTQAELAERAGVSRRWLSMVENGQNRGAEFTKVSKALAVLGKQFAVVDAPARPRTSLPSWLAGGGTDG
ncbi:MAG: helix-turn-helix domain-containing protein [Propionibacteriaceae bacterium]|nr:helix-turn-helix domain-containing protein [Propionibacteriaceae bacterium]